MRKQNQLNPLKIARTKTAGRYCDGGGLWLQVSPTGTKAWLFRYMRHGKAKAMGLGPLDTVSLAEARVRARQARQLLLDGRDPLDTKREAVTAAIASEASAMTFAACADALFAQLGPTFRNDKHRKQWRTALDRAKQAFGSVDVAAIDTPMLVKLLGPVWEKTPESGSRLRGRIERVLDWATAGGFRNGENPARWSGHLEHILVKKAKADHHKAMPFDELPGYMVQLRRLDSISAKALEFTILTASRTSEAIGAKWSEFDMKAHVWTVPAERMKSNRPHRVPLSPRVVELLKSLPRVSGGFVFPGAKERQPLSNMAMLELLRGTAANGFTVHGFRSAFSDWARERTAYPRDVVEMALAHLVKDKTEAAYRRGDALLKRTKLMTEWARYCGQPSSVENVIAMSKAMDN
jgi:integrase